MHRELTLLTHERLAVCDLDDSPISRELIRAVADADQYDFRQTLSDDAAAVNLLERGEVAAVLIIPNDFSEKFYRSESVSLAFLQDGSNTLQASYASAPMQSICAAFNGFLYVAGFFAVGLHLAGNRYATDYPLDFHASARPLHIDRLQNFIVDGRRSINKSTRRDFVCNRQRVVRFAVWIFILRRKTFRHVRNFLKPCSKSQR